MFMRITQFRVALRCLRFELSFRGRGGILAVRAHHALTAGRDRRTEYNLNMKLKTQRSRLL